jgi:hypothetical protein
MTLTAEQWNNLYPVGTPIVAYPSVRPEHEQAPWACERLETTTRSVAWNLSHGQPVVLVDGHAGGIILTHVDPVTGK